MTAENKKILDKINAYAEEKLADIDPQKTRISFQLEALKPIMQEIADENNMKLEDVFIKYMDLASVVTARQNARLKEDFDENGLTNFVEMP